MLQVSSASLADQANFKGKNDLDGIKKPGAGLSTCPRARRGVEFLADEDLDFCQARDIVLD